MKSRSVVFAIALILAPGIALSESVYKWTDENGVVHFGDRQPTGQRAETVNVRTGGHHSAGERPSPQERVRDLEQREQEAEESQRQSAENEARDKQRLANCETARKNLGMLRTGQRVQIVEDGERRYLTPEEIQQQIQESQDIIDVSCESGQSGGDV